MDLKILCSTLVVAALSLTPVMGQAESAAGAYLSANQANLDNDYEAAARLYTRALENDPEIPFLLQNALLAHVAKGDMERGIELTEKMRALEFDSQLTDLITLGRLIKEEKFTEALALLDDGVERYSPLLQGLVKGWALLGQGQMAAASEHFDTMDGAEALKVFGAYHKALALAVVGDFEGANKIFEGDGQPLHLNRGSITAHALVLSQIGQPDRALYHLDRTIGVSGDRQLTALRDRIRAKGEIDYDFVTSANEGVAEVFFTLASALSGEQGDRFALMYTRIAQYLREDNAMAYLLSAELLREQGQHDLAIKDYARVAEDDPLFLDAEFGRADTLLDADKTDAAIEVLRGLARSHSEVQAVHTSLADALRGQERYEDALQSYDQAVSLVTEENPSHWFLFYARAVTLERLGIWDKAEADFRHALELSPGQPLVLNYLGYSLVEKNMKLDEAQEMIEQAVSARPDDGYITDSLGWLLYRVGKFEEAVEPMERAVALVPNDPIINDHLGDVYWKVGRTREARFQWKRSLSFEPEEEEAARIRLKLDIGLDAVLENEAAGTSGTGDGDK
jgi:tetratricopeptide (TPR) repeat protein